MNDLNFFEFLNKTREFGNLQSPDFIAYALPLLEEVKRIHEMNRVALISSISKIHFSEHLTLNGQPEHSLKQNDKLFEKEDYDSTAIEIKDSVTQHTDLGSGKRKYENADIQSEEDKIIVRPVFILNYGSWDYELGHYDPLTDVFVLGQVLASIAFGLDFRNRDELVKFVENRENLYFLNQDLHPTILNVIYEMTHLYRDERTANLEEVITKLKYYREYNPEHYKDLTETDGFRKQNVSDRSQWIINRLKNRLFDITRRNKLLYFKENKSFMNLTVGSVPLLLDYKNIQENDLIFWNDNIRKKIVTNQKLDLNRYLEFKNNNFLYPTINKIRLEARKSRNEYGYSPMRMVIAFLHWYNFKEDSHERITSPLLLMPTDIVKKKGVKDQFKLVFSGTEAEINPILSYYLKELYGINLPDFIDLATTTIEELIKGIQLQISSGGTGITLNWVSKPQIQLIHTIAKKNFNLKNRKLANRTRSLSLRSFNYSYKSENYEPLGLQIFNKRIKPSHDYLEYIINEDLNPNNNKATADKSRTFYRTTTHGEVNPTIWEVNTCNMTIGNFNYRKMSLVRDYNEIINAQVDDEIFDQLFSEFPKKLTNKIKEKHDLASQYPIISSDPTQTDSIALARTGESYIIQGPPGTGKSQTITNLIADYIARGKKILFVCEKRAALDVVFHRLKNKHLDEFCCLIHDSQADKKAFIHNLRDTYNDFIDNPMSIKKITKKRADTISLIDAELDKLKYYHATMKNGDITPIELFEVLHHTAATFDKPSLETMLDYPTYKEFKDHLPLIRSWLLQINQYNIGAYISDFVLNNISSEILSQPNPKKVILEQTDESNQLLDDYIEFSDNYDDDFSDGMTIGELKEQFDLSARIINVVKADKIMVFDAKSKASQTLLNDKNAIDDATSEYRESRTENRKWKQKFSAVDCQSALTKWNKFNQSIFRYINPSYYKLKKKIESAYDFSAHAIAPEISTILQNLKEEHQLGSKLTKLKEDVERNYGLKQYDVDYNWIQKLQETNNLFIAHWANHDCKENLLSLNKFKPTFDRLYTSASSIINDVDSLTISALETQLGKVKEALGSLSTFIPFIKDSKNMSNELRSCLFSKKWKIEEYHYQLAYKSLQDIMEKERVFEDMNADTLLISSTRVSKLLERYYDDNVAYIRAKTRADVLNKVRITESLASQLTPEEKVLKKTYKSARRILENEFGKKMRYKSIRELSASDASSLMNAIKPVWLMSPQSVSDTMPIDPSKYDVVIYDEASQITVEEGVPALFRTSQTIIVGDEMQMPPTNFFSSNTYSDEEDEEVENKIGITLDADSLLNQGSRKLSSVMLGWHYRSRHESLISFSNAAFYQRSLLTIPDSKIQQKSGEGIPAISSVLEPIDIDQILDRSISYHYLENAIYHQRTNTDEADYIANMVCEMLKKKIKLSIGIVAFSMDQQSAIESSLERLALKDPEFDTLLEEEYQREDEDQFNGLFVKNLENVQGDERDIIIMSICYGHNAKGRMLMNFGPINRRGGEKRLNVIFSRAKRHMIIVSSILSNEIKNDYNEGANYFKKFLSYAKHISDGNLNHADLILDGMYNLEEVDTKLIKNPVLLQIKSALELKGYHMDVNIGQSHFKCDLGLKKMNSKKYLLGIILDKPSYYSNDNVIEQYCQKPTVLTAFGWNTYTVYSKDWLDDPKRVLERIEQVLQGKSIIDDSPLLDELDNINPNNDYGVSTPKQTQVEPKEEEREPASNISTGYKRYEFISDTSMKFWEVKTIGEVLYVQYGRIGKNAKEITKVFSSGEEAQKEMETRIRTKLKKGYLKVDENI